MDVPDWLIEFLDGISLWDAIAISAVIIAVVWFIVKKGWRGATSFARAILHTSDVMSKLDVLPDFTVRVDAFMDRTDERMAKNTEVLEAHTEVLDAHTRQLENTHSTNLRDDIDGAAQAAAGAQQTAEEAMTAIRDMQEQLGRLADAINPKGTS